MARYLLDHSLEVKNRRILDFAAGCGMAAIAAAQLGARVEAAEIDDFALSAISLNADANNVRVDIAKGNVLERSDCPWDLILAGDVCYEKSMTDHVMAWLRRCAASGSEVLIADPGRAYLPHQGLLRLAAYTIPTRPGSGKPYQPVIPRCTVWSADRINARTVPVPSYAS